MNQPKNLSYTFEPLIKKVIRNIVIFVVFPVFFIYWNSSIGKMMDSQEIHYESKIDSLEQEIQFQESQIDSLLVDSTDLSIDFAYNVTGTKYQPVVAQCDATPYNTADGAFIDTTKLKKGEIRWCALSRDLLWYKGGKFHYGDTLYVHSEQEAIKGYWIVHDCMNARYTKRIDFLQWFDSDIHGQNPNLIITNKPIGYQK